MVLSFASKRAKLLLAVNKIFSHRKLYNVANIKLLKIDIFGIGFGHLNGAEL